MHPPVARDPIRAIAASRIREVANSAIGAADVLAFWFGEPDLPTPGFIIDAAKSALDSGDTFYHPNLGLTSLRTELAAYVSRWHRPVDAGRIAVTSSGVNALMLATQTIVSPGDRVVAITPLWPNLSAMSQVLGARIETFPLDIDWGQGRWRLDIDRLLATLTPDTRLLMVNSPGNPTGWVITPEEQRLLIAHCRRHGIWILSDEAYERLVFDGSDCAASFLDSAEDEDRLIVANTFSKTWQMTGWRLGWLVLPAPLVADVEKLVEFNTSCAPGFVQQAGIAALLHGEEVARGFARYVRNGTDTLIAGLRDVPRVEAVMPDGAMYVLLRVDGTSDSLALAKSLVAKAGLGLAPGIAFGPECEGFLRWCTARPADTLKRGIDRLDGYLRSLD
jgi:aspartate/methionine/tyrosine aminotransferase